MYNNPSIETIAELTMYPPRAPKAPYPSSTKPIANISLPVLFIIKKTDAALISSNPCRRNRIPAVYVLNVMKKPPTDKNGTRSGFPITLAIGPFKNINIPEITIMIMVLKINQIRRMCGIWSGRVSLYSVMYRLVAFGNPNTLNNLAIVKMDIAKKRRPYASGSKS
jgi:hypothetical protein